MEYLTGISLLEKVERPSYSENFPNEGSVDKISCVFTHEYKVSNNENFVRLLVFLYGFHHNFIILLFLWYCLLVKNSQFFDCARLIHIIGDKSMALVLEWKTSQSRLLALFCHFILN